MVKSVDETPMVNPTSFLLEVSIKKTGSHPVFFNGFYFDSPRPLNY